MPAGLHGALCNGVVLLVVIMALNLDFDKQKTGKPVMTLESFACERLSQHSGYRAIGIQRRGSRRPLFDWFVGIAIAGISRAAWILVLSLVTAGVGHLSTVPLYRADDCDHGCGWRWVLRRLGQRVCAPQWTCG